MEPNESGEPYRYEEARRLLSGILGDFRILSGDSVGDPEVSWQDVAGTAATSLHTLSLRMAAARKGYVEVGPVVFPSPEDLT